MVAAPLVMSVVLNSEYDTAALAEERQSAIDFARYCLPQVFFYGMFVLVGQILNSRGRFGPMMWAPIANNVISVAVLVTYLVVFGAAEGAETVGPFSTDQELLLGVGSTLGIAAQLLILVPYLRKAGFTYRPRFDFRNTGLGRELKLAQRDRATLQKCRTRYMANFHVSEVIATPELDYEYRFYCNADDFAEAVRWMVLEIDYEKFKPTTLRNGAGGKHLHMVYNEIWHVVFGAYWRRNRKDR